VIHDILDLKVGYTGVKTVSK